MALRNARAYSRKYARPYTRKSKVKSKNYIKTIPQQKVVKFFMGNIKEFNKGKYPCILRLISKQTVQIRDNALESSRQMIHKLLEEAMPGSYYLCLKKYPHHIIRENRVYSGGSKGERVNTGMQMSFGTAIGRAALVKQGEELYVVAVPEKKFVPIARRILEHSSAKLPCTTQIVYEEQGK